MSSHIKIRMLLTALAITLTLGLYSCDIEDPTSTTLTENLDFESYGSLIETIEISVPTLDKAICIENEMEPERIKKGGMFAGKLPMFKFKGLFDTLNLSEEQKASVKAFFLTHIECQMAARQIYFEKISAIIEASNLERQSIIDQYKAGTITKEEAGVLLKELKEKTQAEIEASGAKTELLAALQLCFDTLVENIKSVLTEEQLAIFNTWLESHPIGTGNEKDPGGKGKGHGHGHKG